MSDRREGDRDPADAIDDVIAIKGTSKNAAA
jgi:hypothetical protein